ncbi:MAG: hypothetical protein SVU88_00010 [Candidatus Nanohaloarchaea archaeon]|nr:hypothetical protein [Candidatus Nanohaloarchaea archaeon]
MPAESVASIHGHVAQHAGAISGSAVTGGATAAVLLAVGYLFYRWAADDGLMDGGTPDETALLSALDEHDGKTTRPVLQEETGWSAAKLSRVAERLEADGKLETLQLGRKSIVQRPEKSAGEP